MVRLQTFETAQNATELIGLYKEGQTVYDIPLPTKMMGLSVIVMVSVTFPNFFFPTHLRTIPEIRIIGGLDNNRACLHWNYILMYWKFPMTLIQHSVRICVDIQHSVKSTAR